MTDQELQQLAREYANKHLISGCFNVNGESKVDVRDLAYFYETLLTDIAKTHCIADKDKAKAFYNGDTFGELDFIELVSCRRILESLFGKSTFENSKEQEI